MDKLYYTKEEVMKLLDKPRSTFYREVEEGIIPSILEEGRRRGRKFPKQAIDAHIKLMKKKRKSKLTFGPTTNSELWAGYENSVRLYDPEDIVDYETLLEWREVNYDIFMTAREGEKRAGGITIIPLAESVIHSLINGKIREKDIPLWAIRKWTDPELSVYIPSISITHTGDKQKDTERGIFIIRSTIRWAFSLDRQHDIKNWYAIAATPQGEKLVKHLGFQKIEGKRDAYLLEDLKKGTRPIRAFLEQLDQLEEIPIPTPRTSKASS
jgi:predicted DNA-binding transcriptional regulator AlpA